MIQFDINAKEEKARLGKLQIKDMELSTPLFIPQTNGFNINAMFPDKVQKLDLNVIFTDIYKPLMRIGLDTIHKAGSLSNLMNYNGFLFLGAGIQELYNSNCRYKSKEEGLDLASYVDGSSHKLSPETSIRIQKKMGATIFSALYYIPSSGENNFKKQGAASRRSFRWVKRAMDVYKGEFKGTKSNNLSFFAPITGGIFSELRTKSAQEIAKLNPDGFLQTPPLKNESRIDWKKAVAASTNSLPSQKPAAVLGVETIAEIYEMISMGMDIIISDFPIKDALNGMLYTDSGVIDIKQEQYKEKKDIFEQNYTLAYLHHLYTAGELQGFTLGVSNNLRYITGLMNNIQTAIAKSAFHNNNK